MLLLYNKTSVSFAQKDVALNDFFLFLIHFANMVVETILE